MRQTRFLIALLVFLVTGIAHAAPTYSGTIDFYDSSGNHIGHATVTCGVGIHLNWGTTSGNTLVSNPVDCNGNPLSCDDVGQVEVGACSACGSTGYESLYNQNLVDPCN